MTIRTDEITRIRMTRFARLMPHGIRNDRRLIVGCLLLLMAALTISGCGGSGGTMDQPVPQSTWASFPGTLAQADTSTPKLVFNSGAATDLAGLHIQTNGVDCGKNIVLNGLRPSYDSGAFDEMNAFITAIVNQQAVPPTPDTLRLVPGTIGDTDLPDGGCSGVLQVTNTTDASIQIDSIGIRLLAPSVSNTFTYRLIDSCRLGAQPPAPGDCGFNGRGDNCALQADLRLVPSTTSGLYMKAQVKQLSLDPSCPTTATIGSGDTAEIIFHATSSPPNTLYRVALLMHVITPSGQSLLALPAGFVTTLSLASAAQFICYKRSGNTFAVESADEQKQWLSDGTGGQCV